MKSRTHNPGFSRKIDTIELSDAFRRHASFGQPELVKELVKEARKFAAATTWYHTHETWFHERVIENTTKAVTRMAEMAKKLGADEITLPVSGDRRAMFTNFFNKKILPTLDLPVKVTLQQGEYAKDLTHMGRIDKRIKTAIDEGLRGMADIDQNLRFKWDRNPKPSSTHRRKP